MTQLTFNLMYSVFLGFLKYSIPMGGLNFYKKYSVKIFCLSYLETMLLDHLNIYQKPINKGNTKPSHLILRISCKSTIFSVVSVYLLYGFLFLFLKAVKFVKEKKSQKRNGCIRGGKTNACIL